MLPNMFLAYIRLIFRGFFVEITTAILLVNPELPWQKQHSTTRRLFSPANWT
jgi:hypothetical protein